MIKILYSVDIEFRYLGWSKEKERATNNSKTITIGVYESYNEAVKAGNEILEKELETRFPLNKNWNKKNRFGDKYTEYLISDLAYLTTPFSFFAHIKKLELGSVSDTIDKVLASEKEYQEGKKLDSDNI